MNKYHKEIVALFSSYSGNYLTKLNKDYVGSGKFHYHIDVPTSRKLLKDWINKHPDITLVEFEDLLNSLALGKSHNEVTAIGKLLEYMPELRSQINPKSLDKWLDYAEGWAEVDSICQSPFTVEEILSKWSGWKRLIQDLAKSSNIHKRRASLVILTGVVCKSSDSHLTKLAFDNINKLKAEKDILITKAISWLLRDLIKLHRGEIEVFLAKNANTLPKIAIRETKNKLKRGRKSGK